MTPLRGLSLRGARLLADAPFGKWRTQTFIAGLRQDGLVAPLTIEGAMDGAAFDAYVRTQLAPTLTCGDVVILDNLNVHKSTRAAKALEERGAWFLFLPNYSPDLKDRKSVVSGKSVSVRVDLGGRRIIKKKNNTNKKTEKIK